MSFDHALRRFRSALTGALAVAALATVEAPGAFAQDDDEAVMPSAAERVGLTRGRHRLSLFVGQQRGGLAVDEDISTPPVDSLFGLRLDYEDGTVAGLRYGYQFHENWGIEVSYTRTSSELTDGETLEQALARPILDSGGGTVTVREELERAVTDTDELDAFLARLAERDGPADVDLTMVDVGFVYVMNPRGRWVGEINAGLGWSSSSIPGGKAIFETLLTTDVTPAILVNTLPSDDPTEGQDCPFADEPCRSLEESSGLTWHVGGGVSYAFNDTVHLRFNARARWIENAVDPGDSFLMPEGTVGLSFVLGGQ